MPESVLSDRRSKRLTRYATAIALAILAQIARIPLHTPAILPFVTYAPFVVLGAMAGGLGPGLLTTILCTLEAVYFAVEPNGFLALLGIRNWAGPGALLVTGVVAGVMAERLRRAGRQLKEAHAKTTSILDCISDGFNAFDREWRYTYVNPAGAKLVGKEPGELLGENLWELWPAAEDSEFGIAYRRAVAENVPVQVEGFYGDPLNAWFEVRCYPSPHGLTLFFTDTTERKRADERLRLLEAAVLQASDGVLIVEVAENFYRQDPIFANSAFERITGFNLEDLRNGAIELLFRPWLSPSVNGARALVPMDVEQPAVRKDGSDIWVEWNFTPLTGGQGGQTRCAWTCRDITERKKADEAARLFTSIVEDSDDAILSKTLDGIVLTWNKGAERIYGYASQEMVGKPISLLIPPEHGQELPDILDNLRRGARMEHYETERVGKDGRRMVVWLTISPIRNSRNYIVGASVIARAITEQKRAEEALALSEERYRSLVLATAQIVWTSNARGEVVDDVPMWREFTGQSVDEIRGWGRFQALHPDDRERITDLWARAVRSRSFYNAEYRVRRHDGEYRWVAVHGVPVLEKDGNIREWIGTCADIQDRKQAEEEICKLNAELERRVVERTVELEAANGELEAFAYSVSHDLRAPLRAVDGFSRILLEEYAPQLPGEARHFLTVARKNAVQMGELIDGLLSFSRLGRQSLDKQLVAPDAIVRLAWEELRSEQEGRRVEITLGALPACEADPLLLKQVYVNLLSNGLKYTRTREVARLEVGTLPGEPWIPSRNSALGPAGNVPVYYVRDNGVGFDMRYAGKLFGVFQRLHGSLEYPGTGVGLAIVQRIVHRHGGRVWANATLNEGATFFFVLSNAGQAQSGGGELK